MATAGTYVITLAGGAVGSNYTAEYINGTLTVNEIVYGPPMFTVHGATDGLMISPANAFPGTIVTVTIEDGYGIDGVRVINGKGEAVRIHGEDGIYRFEMPYGNVKVEGFANPFADVNESDYFYDAVLWGYANGITLGTGEDAFSPDAGCTRAEIVTFLWRAAGCPEPSGADSGFSDVPVDSYYAKAVLWAVEQGITLGTDADSFEPDAACPRAQIVTFLGRFAKAGTASGSNPFDDVPADAYYADFVYWAYMNGITNGTDENSFSPDEGCTRAQCLAFLYRYCAN